jgi:hypothetical protein
MVAGVGIISAVLLLPAIVLVATTAQPPLRTRSACRLANTPASRPVLAAAGPNPSGQATTAGTALNVESVAQIVRSSAKAQLRLLKLVELGLRAAHGDGWSERRTASLSAR